MATAVSAPLNDNRYAFRRPLFRSQLGVKRTCLFALQMSAFDPKRTSSTPWTAASDCGNCRVLACIFATKNPLHFGVQNSPNYIRALFRRRKSYEAKRCSAHPTAAPISATCHHTATAPPISKTTARPIMFACSLADSVQT
jgi:hypothetical protein